MELAFFSTKSYERATFEAAAGRDGHSMSMAGVTPGMIATVKPTPSDVRRIYSIGAAVGDLGASFAR